MGLSTTGIIVVGANHLTATVALRERMAFSRGQACEAFETIRSRGVMKEVVILSTCNRTELYGVPIGCSADCAGDLEDFLVSYHRLRPEDVNGSLYRHSDRDAVRHIYRVASGLDSMLLGEAEILGQVREAYRTAFEQRATGRVLNRLFQSALEVGKHVRTDTRISVYPMSVAFAAVKLAEAIFSPLSDHRALVLGAGATSGQVVWHLRHRGIQQIRILNRTEEHARDVAARYGGEVMSWDSLPVALEWPDLVVASVSSAEPVLSRDVLARAMESRANRVLMLIDLGVPRNVATGVSDLKGVHLYNIDDLEGIVLQNKKAREQEVPRAEQIIEEHVENFTHWQAGVSAWSMLEDLRAGPAIDHDTFLRKHSEAITYYSDRERAYVMELLKEFLNGTVPETAKCVRDDPEMWSKLRDLEALCVSLVDDRKGRR